MSDQNLVSNPFSALFSTIDEAQQFAEKSLPETSSVVDDATNFVTDVAAGNKQISTNSYFLEAIFLITVDRTPSISRPKLCVYLSDLKESLKDQTWLDEDCLEQALFERLMLTDVEDHLIETGSQTIHEGDVKEHEVLKYLCQCYLRATELLKSEDINQTFLAQCRSAVIANASLCLTNAEIFMEQDITAQFLDLYYQYRQHHAYDIVCEFIHCTADHIYDQSSTEGCNAAFKPMLDNISKSMVGLELMDVRVHQYLELFSLFCSHPRMCMVFMEYNKVAASASGSAYQRTLLGGMLSLSCICSQESLITRRSSPFFNEPAKKTNSDIELEEDNAQQLMSNLCTQLFQIMKKIMKHGKSAQHLMLSWIADCLHANIGRGKLWTGQTRGLLQNMYASDGFMLNLCFVLLQFCQPFSNPTSLTFPTTAAKILKVAPSYCLATAGSDEERTAKCVHCKGLSSETCLVPKPEESSEMLELSDSYNFITEMFYMTHHALALGFHVVEEFFGELNQELHRIQNAYHDIMGQGGQNSDAGQQMTKKMDNIMKFFLCYKAALTQPQILELSFNFNVTTSVYLCHLAANRAKTGSPINRINFPLNDAVPIELSCMPEFVANNVVDLLLFLRRHKMKFFDTEGNNLGHLLTFIMTFMGSSSRMRNPHMRAHLAEALEALMPQTAQTNSFTSSFHRHQLFQDELLSGHLSHTLLSVFVAIEMSGESVEFEMKFNYRRPMYAVLKYIWSVELHQTKMIALAEEAEVHIEDADPPLALRFINLLINDSIFLLDEALSYMSQIREQLQAKDSGEWESLSANQRRENESNLRQISMLARFHNMMGLETIRVLDMLTEKIQSIFTHAVMSDRIAAMLNYFLLHLVGPKRKNIKVKDLSKYKFEPQKLVSLIAQIYINLGRSDSFCKSVCSDGRSYSIKLFNDATTVLRLIHQQADKIAEFSNTAAKIKEFSNQHLAEDAALKDAPAEFLDPLMGTVMKDPVLLPSSGNIVDRSTIARHLLSDQTDPYNRSPLTMDMVKTDTDLLKKITDWLQEVGNNQPDASSEATEDFSIYDDKS